MLPLPLRPSQLLLPRLRLTAALVSFAAENNHSPYTAVQKYTDAYPNIKAGSMKRVYNSNMLAVDDAIGFLRASLQREAPTFGRKTLIVFSQDNGGPAKMANNLPLRGAKFGVYKGGVRSNTFLWGPGVLPDTAPGKVYNGIFHLCDYYATLASVAGASTDNTGPAGPLGFDKPDGIDQWAAIVAAAKGAPLAQNPRNEVVLDLNLEKPIYAIRVGDYKLIYGNVGVADIIADDEWPCTDCCPLKRPPLTPSTKADICANARGAVESVDELTAGERGLGATAHSTSLADSPCSEALPCLYDVVNDPTENVNLANSSAHQAVLAQLRERIAFHTPRTYDFAIDHTNWTAAQYCQIVKGELPAVSKGLWAEPFGFAPPAPAPTPPSPMPASLPGTWCQAQKGAKSCAPGDEFLKIIASDPTGFTVSSLNCSGCCWNQTHLSGEYFAAAGEVVLSGRANSKRCKVSGADEIKGGLSNGVIAWMTVWVGKTWYKAL